MSACNSPATVAADTSLFDRGFENIAGMRIERPSSPEQSVERGSDDLPGGDLIHEQSHPRAKRLHRRMLCGQNGSRFSEVIQFSAIDCLDKSVATAKVTVERANTHTRTPCDFI